MEEGSCQILAKKEQIQGYGRIHMGLLLHKRDFRGVWYADALEFDLYAVCHFRFTLTPGTRLLRMVLLYKLHLCTPSHAICDCLPPGYAPKAVQNKHAKSQIRKAL